MSGLKYIVIASTNEGNVGQPQVTLLIIFQDLILYPSWKHCVVFTAIDSTL